MHSCMSHLFKCSITWSSSTKGKSSLFQIFPLVLGTWVSKPNSTSHSVASFCCWCICTILSCYPSCPDQIQFQVGFGFQNPIHTWPYSVSAFLLDHLSMQSPLVCFLNVFKISVKFIVQPHRPPATFACQDGLILELGEGDPWKLMRGLSWTPLLSRTACIPQEFFQADPWTGQSLFARTLKLGSCSLPFSPVWESWTAFILWLSKRK